MTYEELDRIEASESSLYVDFAGDESLRARVHHHFGAQLVYDCYAGSAQNTQFLRRQNLPGPEPKFYFAPVQIKKRNADWGPEVVTQRFNEAQLRFIQRVSDPDRPWLRVIEQPGYAAAQLVIEQLHQGRADPQQGHVVILS